MDRRFGSGNLSLTQRRRGFADEKFVQNADFKLAPVTKLMLKATKDYERDGKMTISQLDLCARAQLHAVLVVIPFLCVQTPSLST